MASNNYHHHHQQASSTSSSSGASSQQQANGNPSYYQLPNGEFIAANTIDLASIQWLNATAGAVAQNQQQAHQQQQSIYLQQGQHLLNVIEQMPQQHQPQQHHVQPQQHHQQVPVASSKASAKPRGRVTSYAFFVQTQHQEHQKKRPSDGINFRDFSRMCSEKWKGMTDEDKQPFHEMAENDKKRYDDEMREYVPDPSLGGAGGSKKRKRAPKDPDAPKKALSAFFLFCHDERGAIKERNPSYSVGEVAKELGKLWADADPEIKNKYKEAAENAKLRYNEEFAEYQQKKTREANGDYSTSSHRSPETY